MWREAWITAVEGEDSEMSMKTKVSLLSARYASLLFIVAALLFLGMAFPHVAAARSGGVSGYSGNPSTCTICHTAGATVPTVTITGPTSLAPSASGVYTLTITGGPALDGGLDVSTSAGTLTVSDTKTKLLNGEITHNAPAPFSGNTLSFTFTLTAPASGTVTLYGSGLSANGSGSGGDGTGTSTLVVTVAAATAPHITVTDPVAPADDHQMAFGTVTDGLTSSLTVTVGNSGDADLKMGTIGGGDPLSAPFSIQTDNCSGKTIAPAGTCTIVVKFAPTAVGPFSDSFDIPSDDPSTPSITFSVSGTGSSASEPQITVTDPVAPANDLTLPFGTVQNGLFSEQTVTVGNSGNADLAIVSVASTNPLSAPFSITADNCSTKTLAPAASCTITVKFAPSAAGPFQDSFNIQSNDPSMLQATFNVSGSGNDAPTAPALVSPTDGQTGIGTTATLEWKRSTDPNGDAVSYHVYYCTDSTFVSCTPVNVAMQKKAGIFLAFSGLLFAGFVVRKGARGKTVLLVLLAVLLLSTGILLTACGSNDAAFIPTTPPPATTNMTHQASGLTGGSLYYWKVVADDGKGGLATSPTWTFSTM
jgi:hypothetical protein